MELKTCSRCGFPKPATPEFFGRSSDAKDGFRSECKLCRKGTTETPNMEDLETRLLSLYTLRDNIENEIRHLLKSTSLKTRIKNKSNDIDTSLNKILDAVNVVAEYFSISSNFYKDTSKKKARIEERHWLYWLIIKLEIPVTDRALSRFFNKDRVTIKYAYEKLEFNAANVKTYTIIAGDLMERYKNKQNE